MAISGLVLVASGLPRDLRQPARPHELREIPEVYGRNVIGWETLPEKLLRDHRDLTLADVLAHPAPARPEAARSRCGPAADAGRRAGRPPGRRARSRGWSSAAAWTERSALDDAERLAEWLDAEYEPFGAHSHFGLIVGEQSHQQVAEAIRASWRRTGSKPVVRAAVEASRGSLVSCRPAPASDRRSRPCRIRLEAQDTALSRRRSPVRIRYAVPVSSDSSRLRRVAPLGTLQPVRDCAPAPHR